MTVNALSDMRQQPDLEQRLADLESKVEDMELVLAELVPLPRRSSGSLVSWLWGLQEILRFTSNR
jgi:hypothetical protein